MSETDKKPIIDLSSKVQDNPKYIPERDHPMSVTGDFTVAVVGDIVQTRPITQLEDSDVQAALAPVKDADFAIGNLEQAIGNFREFEGYEYGVGAFLVMAKPEIADDLAAMGFDILSRANNRLSDFGIEGNRETDGHLKRVGIEPVGFGEHLSQARAPCYKDVEKGRMSAIGVTSSFQPGGEKAFFAAARIGNAKGRPGVNGLHVSRTITLPPQAWDSLNEFIGQANYAFPFNYPIQATLSATEDCVQIMHNIYVKGEKAGYSYKADREQVEILMKEIRNAAAYSNFNVFTIHSHQWMIDPHDPLGGFHGETKEPPDFLVELAHEAIDNGCDMFCVHGPFEFRAIEIYKGKPIFYSLGSFIRQPYQQDIVPWETYSAHKFIDRDYPSENPIDTKIEDAKFLLERTGRHPASYFRGASISCEYSDSKLKKIIIHPVDLGIDGPLSDLGIPKIASEEVANNLLNEIAQLSVPYGTKLEIKDGLGVIKLEQ
ncbi:MAG TPA: hypothetical protein DCS89_19780 [Gammaproteobacteria bacterium]|nr:hypothetical protein [Gammaproteobacteria bacterium]HAT29265.1 hypothetical protein [Gammaproteobacteria bacterium]|tara:strand:- start:3303 stop:4766 length:1464 start_codon:yes stop_codon:yes gene_type:complete